MDDWVGVGVGYGGAGEFGEDDWVGKYSFLFLIFLFLIFNFVWLIDVVWGGLVADGGRSLGLYRLVNWRLRCWGVLFISLRDMEVRSEGFTVSYTTHRLAGPPFCLALGIPLRRSNPSTIPKRCQAKGMLSAPDDGMGLLPRSQPS